jgi:hypothetical protein
LVDARGAADEDPRLVDALEHDQAAEEQAEQDEEAQEDPEEDAARQVLHLGGQPQCEQRGRPQKSRLTTTITARTPCASRRSARRRRALPASGTAW